MLVFTKVSDLRNALDAERREGKRVGFVPTMGNLHEGHLDLVRLAQKTCQTVVASIFVNPLQFGLSEDWEQYPRTFNEDRAKLEQTGCDYLFYPDENEMYPNGMATQTKVEVPIMTDILCGASRPGHFLGVTTVVAKLLNMVQPDDAIFGIKDYQQLTLIKRMVQDLCVRVNIIAGAITRASDGLALSSRNSYLSVDERPLASQLNKSLCWVREQIEAGKRNFADLETEARKQLEVATMRPDYISVRHAKTLEPASAQDKELVILGAVYMGNTRLIDNQTLSIHGQL